MCSGEPGEEANGLFIRVMATNQSTNFTLKQKLLNFSKVQCVCVLCTVYMYMCITGYSSSLYIGTAMVFVFSPYIEIHFLLSVSS